MSKRRNTTKTSSEEFYLPILQVIVSQGGKVRVADVYEPVRLLLGSKLKPVDFTPTESKKPEEPLWRNTTRNARHEMVIKGWLKTPDESGRGFWEVTERGRCILQSRVQSRS